MRAIIVASSPYDVFEQIYKPIPGDLIIGVDGGCKAIKKYPIDIAFGDFDKSILSPCFIILIKQSKSCSAKSIFNFY